MDKILNKVEELLAPTNVKVHVYGVANCPSMAEILLRWDGTETRFVMRKDDPEVQKRVFEALLNCVGECLDIIKEAKL